MCIDEQIRTFTADVLSLIALGDDHRQALLCISRNVPFFQLTAPKMNIQISDSMYLCDILHEVVCG